MTSRFPGYHDSNHCRRVRGLGRSESQAACTEPVGHDARRPGPACADGAGGTDSAAGPGPGFLAQPHTGRRPAGSEYIAIMIVTTAVTVGCGSLASSGPEWRWPGQPPPAPPRHDGTESQLRRRRTRGAGAGLSVGQSRGRRRPEGRGHRDSVTVRRTATPGPAREPHLEPQLGHCNIALFLAIYHLGYI